MIHDARTCHLCHHDVAAHASVTNDGCLVEGCMCEMDDPRFDGPDCGVDGCQREVGHIGDHHRMPPDPASPFADLEAENARLRKENDGLYHAIENFILWWDNPPYVLDDDDALRIEVDALRVAAQEALRD